MNIDEACRHLRDNLEADQTVRKYIVSVYARAKNFKIRHQKLKVYSDKRPVFLTGNRYLGYPVQWLKIPEA